MGIRAEVRAFGGGDGVERCGCHGVGDEDVGLGEAGILDVEGATWRLGCWIEGNALSWGTRIRLLMLRERRILGGRWLRRGDDVSWGNLIRLLVRTRDIACIH